MTNTWKVKAVYDARRPIGRPVLFGKYIQRDNVMLVSPQIQANGRTGLGILRLGAG